jgi:hypothetical protein
MQHCSNKLKGKKEKAYRRGRAARDRERRRDPRVGFGQHVAQTTGLGFLEQSWSEICKSIMQWLWLRLVKLKVAGGREKDNLKKRQEEVKSCRGHMMCQNALPPKSLVNAKHVIAL